MTAAGPVVIENDALRVTIAPAIGGTIIAVEYRPSGLSVLGTVPWDPVTTSDGSFAAPDERRWLTRYTGGWPLLFPNGGDACVVDGAVHGFHGEASIAPWTVVIRTAAGLRLRRRFFTVPVTMEREMSLDGDILTVNERITAHGERPLQVLWGQHVTFGADVLAGDFVIETGAATATVDDAYDPPSNPLVPGASGTWPAVPGKDGGAFDLSRPAGEIAAMAYLRDLASAWASVRRTDGSIAAALSWDAAAYPCAWLWYELGGTPEAPWHGRARLLGIEPCSTWPAVGLQQSISRGLPLVTLRPGIEMTTTVRLHVFAPAGRVVGADGDGRALGG
jgi:hypothetical protein